MKGWKTLVGGFGFLIVGFYLILNGETQKGVETILTGLAILGIGHKIDKLTK